MRPLTAAELLDAWEQGLCEPPYRRALPLLVAASIDTSCQEIAALSIGQRDRLLLTLREWTFGSQLASVAECSSCGERLEWFTNVADLQTTQQSDFCGELSVEVDPYTVTFRLPNTSDLAAVADCSATTAARNALLERCVISARLADHEIAIRQLPAKVVEAIAQRMAEADPQADIQLDLLCPACGHHWQALLDIGSFFWSELNLWAQRLLAEIHALASAYGWREADILNLSSNRRQLYLNLVKG